jgi:hypothetical protein
MNVGDIVELRWKPTGNSHERVSMWTGWDHNTSDVFDYFCPQDLGVVLQFGNQYGSVGVMVILLGKATLGWVPAYFLKVVQ